MAQSRTAAPGSSRAGRQVSKAGAKSAKPGRSGSPAKTHVLIGQRVSGSGKQLLAEAGGRGRTLTAKQAKVTVTDKVIKAGSEMFGGLVKVGKGAKVGGAAANRRGRSASSSIPPDLLEGVDAIIEGHDVGTRRNETFLFSAEFQSVSGDLDETLARTVVLLGGEKTLKAAPRSRIEIHDLIARGLPFVAISAVEEGFPSLGKDRLSEMIGTSVRTMQRKSAEKNAALEPDKGGSLWSVAALLSKAEAVLGNRELAMAWIERPQRGLGGRKPVDLMKTTPGRQEVELLLDRLDHGVYV
jgi:putative toxin-antitoxin system antitoxin component (TIGR02293 family)